MTVYSLDDIQSYFKDIIDEEVSFADIVKLSDKLTALYCNDGYIINCNCSTTKNNRWHSKT